MEVYIKNNHKLIISAFIVFLTKLIHLITEASPPKSNAEISK